MQQVFLQKKGFDNLTVFFSGWAMDENPFLGFCMPESDVMICFDYTGLDFDLSLIDKYATVRVVAWSLGVWAASALMAEIPRLATDAVAVNGTPFPVDASRGIPPEIFMGTLQGLSHSTLSRFARRMCGDLATLESYNRRHPKRSVESLADELAWIGRESVTREVAPQFKRAYVGKRDAIFSCENQVNAWRGECPVEIVDAAHYNDVLLRSLVCGGGEHG